MVPECSFIYPNGHRCQRIPRRGQILCPAHLGRPPLPGPYDPGFAGELHSLGRRLETMRPPQLLAALHRELQAIEPVVSRRFARRHRLAFARAAITLDATLFALLHTPSPQPRRAPAPPLSRPIASAQGRPDQVRPDRGHGVPATFRPNLPTNLQVFPGLPPAAFPGKTPTLDEIAAVFSRLASDSKQNG